MMADRKTIAMTSLATAVVVGLTVGLVGYCYYCWSAVDQLAKRNQLKWISIWPRLLSPATSHQDTAAAAYHSSPMLLQYLGHYKHVIICDPKIAHYVLSHERDFIKMSVPAAASIARFCSSTLMTTNGQTYLAHKTPVANFLNHKSVMGFKGQISRHSQRLIRLLTAAATSSQQRSTDSLTTDGFEIDVGSWMRSFTLDILGDTLLGIDMAALDNLVATDNSFDSKSDRESDSNNSDFTANMSIARAVEVFAREIVNPMHIIIPNYEKLTWLSSNKELQQSVTVIDSYIKDIIAKRDSRQTTITSVNRDTMSNYTMFDAILDNSNFDNSNFDNGKSDSVSSITNSTTNITPESMFGDIINLMIAGHDTTAIALTWAIYLLAIHPDIQDELFAEVTKPNFDMGLDDEVSPSLATLSKTLLGRVINETMRLLPPVAIAPTRTCQQDQLLPFTHPKTGQSYIIPKNSIISYSIWAIQRDPRLWSEPDSFKPQRWLTTNSNVATSHLRDLYFAFSAGKRPCLGREFSLVEQRMVLAELVKHFQLFPCGDSDKSYPPSLKPGIFSAPQKLTVRLIARQ